MFFPIFQKIIFRPKIKDLIKSWNNHKADFTEKR